MIHTNDEGFANKHTDKAYWLNTYGPYTPNPPLSGEVTVDVAIIGGGYTGLATAYFLRQAEPTMRVAVLEGELVGYGASGRNGGFAMTLFGFEPSITARLFGKQRMAEAHRYCERAVDLVAELVRQHDIQSDFEYTGFLRLATTTAYVRRIQHDLELLASQGITGIDWLDQDKALAEVNSPLVLGAWSEARCGILNPAKQVRELKRIAQEAGAVIYEGSPVTEIRRGAHYSLHTPQGRVSAGKIVFATNAYSHLLPELRRKQVPAFTHMVITEPLTAAQLDVLAEDLPGLEDQKRFERTVARHWRLRQALINGHSLLRPQAAQAQADLNSFIADDASRARLSADLLQILDNTTRTSSLIECINGLLKSFINNRQCFHDQLTLQAYLDLFMLWHNMRPYQRGKRQGQSPYQIAGIDPGCNDWLELLGYPAASLPPPKLDSV